MGDKEPYKSKLDNWSITAPQDDLRHASFEPRERGYEADARDRLYVGNAFAVLSPGRELVRAGARAGFQAGAGLVAGIGVCLVVLLAANQSVSSGPPEGLFGATPLSGTIFEPLWPLVVVSGAMPFFAAVGALAALVRRADLRRRKALEHYFEPIRTSLDLVTFMLCAAVLMDWGAHVMGLTGPESDELGVFILTGSLGGIIAWPLHSLWERRYLGLIRRTGSASLAEIKERIARQV